MTIPTANKKHVAISFVAMLLILVGSASSCSRPKEIIPEKELVKLLADLEIAESYLRRPQSGDVYARDSIGLAVLKAHGYTPSQLDSTLGWYGKNVDLYQELYVKVERELDTRNLRASNEEKRQESEGVRNIWPGTQQVLIGGNALSEGLSFSIPEPGIERGEVVEWRMHPIQGNVEVILGADYEEGGSRYTVSNMYSADASGVKFFTDTAMRVTRIFGLLRSLSPSPGSRLLVDSISLNILPLDSSQYYRAFHQKKY